MMRVRKSHLFVCAATVLLSEGSHAFGYAAAARAESLPASGYPRDRYQLSAHAETYAELFRRALLPGANGSLVSTDTVVPLYEYLSLRASDIDTGWRRD